MKSAKQTGKGKGGKRKPKRLPVALDRKGMETLRGAFTRSWTGTRNRSIVELFLGSGLRVSELCNLKTSHVKFEDRLINVVDGKGGKDRSVNVDDYCLTHLQTWKAIRPKTRAKFFFTTAKGGRLSRRYVEAMVGRSAERAGLDPRPTPHGLRHSYACECLRRGITLPELQKLLGHSRIQTTMVYVRVFDSELSQKVTAKGEKAAAERDGKACDVEALALRLAALPEATRKVLAAVLEAK